jgi:hypothetical protein
MVTELSVGRPRSSGPGKPTCPRTLETGNSIKTNPTTDKKTLDGFMFSLLIWKREKPLPVTPSLSPRWSNTLGEACPALSQPVIAATKNLIIEMSQLVS